MDQRKDKKFMNTKFVGHHISAGGYVFFKDETINQLYVILLRNKKGEWWIPKGHVESWEDELHACYREIEEEVGIKKDDLKCIDFLENYKFNFLDINNKENTKEIFIYVFEALKLLKLKVEKGVGDAVVANWFNVKEALEKIMPYSKKQLEDAIILFKSKRSK
jgi:8-oxo-dGTP pyrophosphatase MutT (NUDIX family)